MLLRASALGLVLAAAPVFARADAPKVAVDIAPIHSIVSAVMAGVGAPDLILPPGASPHGHAMRPSEARAVAGADLVVWVGPALTPWLERPVASLGEGAAQVELMEAPGLTLLPVREGAGFEPHDHGHDDHAGEAHAGQAHGHDDHDDHAQDDHGHDGHGHDGHDHGPIDAHVWLDPANAAAIAAAVAARLAELDPENARAYAANAEAFAAEAAALKAEVLAELAPVRGQGYLVFHDAYQYFETAFDLPARGSITLTDGEAPRPGRVADIRATILDAQAVCVFAEPQFDPKLVTALIEDTPARTGTLDPEGLELTPGVALYPALIRGMAGSLKACLAG